MITPITTAAKFWENVETLWKRPEPCWNWQGAVDVTGHASIAYEGRTWTAQRLALHFSGTDIPQGKWVVSTCRNNRCCNPNHLTLNDDVMTFCVIADEAEWSALRTKAALPPKRRRRPYVRVRGRDRRNDPLFDDETLSITVRRVLAQADVTDIDECWLYRTDEDHIIGNERNYHTKVWEAFHDLKWPSWQHSIHTCGNDRCINPMHTTLKRELMEQTI